MTQTNITEDSEFKIKTSNYLVRYWSKMEVQGESQKKTEEEY
jgi:hypothetical protein